MTDLDYWAKEPPRDARVTSKPKRRGRPLPKRECPKCGRLISIMSWQTRNLLRDHICLPREPATSQETP